MVETHNVNAGALRKEIAALDAMLGMARRTVGLLNEISDLEAVVIVQADGVDPFPMPVEVGVLLRMAGDHCGFLAQACARLKRELEAEIAADATVGEARRARETYPADWDLRGTRAIGGEP
jgi:hypothetical protein